eukprot:GHVP01027912.1.p4 GENE.GHVP01027912.1~~GHVP01027912.1.p4  ORF type:complete len:135 (+),score=8.60 GHVP01027912.1:991-1395(+)
MEELDDDGFDGWLKLELEVKLEVEDGLRLEVFRLRIGFPLLFEFPRLFEYTGKLPRVESGCLYVGVGMVSDGFEIISYGVVDVKSDGLCPGGRGEPGKLCQLGILICRSTLGSSFRRSIISFMMGMRSMVGSRK